MAPFQGITTPVFRKVFIKHFAGVDKMFTPFFTNVYKESVSKKKMAELSAPTLGGVPVVPQILSKDPDEILRFARFVHALGFDEVNWNLGCPFPRVANKKRGSGLLSFPVLIKEILEKTLPELPVRLSIKARLGYDSKKDILALIPLLNDLGIQELTVHARIGRQLYQGEADQKAFATIVPLAKMKLGYNGDLFTLNDFYSFSRSFPSVSLIMIGRGLLVDPFLPAAIKKLPVPELQEQKEKIKAFIYELFLTYLHSYPHHENVVLNLMKEYWWYLAHSFEEPHKVFKLIKKRKVSEDFESGMLEVFERFQWVGQQADFFRNQRISG